MPQTVIQHTWAPLPHLTPHHPQGHLPCMCEQFFRNCRPHSAPPSLRETLQMALGTERPVFQEVSTPEDSELPGPCSVHHVNAGGTFPAPRPLPLTGLCRGFCLGWGCQIKYRIPCEIRIPNQQQNFFSGLSISHAIFRIY